MLSPAGTVLLLAAALPTAVVGGVVGFGTGLTMLYLGRRVLDRMGDRAFVMAVEGLVMTLGLLFILFPAS